MINQVTYKRYKYTFDNQYQPTPERPLRHVVTIPNLTSEDLIKIRDTINRFLEL